MLLLLVKSAQDAERARGQRTEEALAEARSRSDGQVQAPSRLRVRFGEKRKKKRG